MCTLIVLHRCVPGSPLVIAANRDEFFDRSAEGPALRMRPSGPIIAPLDLRAGGTWLGLNGHGVFVGLTNLRPDVASRKLSRKTSRESSAKSSDRAIETMMTIEDAAGASGLRSRGEVVMAALDARSAAEAAAHVGGIEEDAYAPFQLLVADASQAHLTVYRGAPRTRILDPGVHMVGNVELDEVGSEVGSTSKLRRIRERAEKLLTQSHPDLLEALGQLCREHVESSDPFASTCIHIDAIDPIDRVDPGDQSDPMEGLMAGAGGYGTRSSLLLDLADAPRASRLWAIEGPPCEGSYEDLSDLLTQLDRASRGPIHP